MRRTMWGVAHGRIGHLARHRRGGRQGSASVNSSDTGGNFNHRVSDIDALTAARHRRTDFRDECHGTTIASFASKTTIATNDLLGPAILTPADNHVVSVNADSSLTVQDSFAQAATHRAAQFPTPSATAAVARSPRSSLPPSSFRPHCPPTPWRERLEHLERPTRLGDRAGQLGGGGRHRHQRQPDRLELEPADHGRRPAEGLDLRGLAHRPRRLRHTGNKTCTLTLTGVVTGHSKKLAGTGDADPSSGSLAAGVLSKWLVPNGSSGVISGNISVVASTEALTAKHH